MLLVLSTAAMYTNHKASRHDAGVRRQRQLCVEVEAQLRDRDRGRWPAATSPARHQVGPREGASREVPTERLLAFGGGDGGGM